MGVVFIFIEIFDKYKQKLREAMTSGFAFMASFAFSFISSLFSLQPAGNFSVSNYCC